MISGAPTALPVIQAPQPGKSTQGRRVKILIPKQMLQILLILLAHAQAGNFPGNLLNEIWKIFYSLIE